MLFSCFGREVRDGPMYPSCKTPRRLKNSISLPQGADDAARLLHSSREPLWRAHGMAGGEPAFGKDTRAPARKEPADRLVAPWNQPTYDPSRPRTLLLSVV
jgi:hypothetical protein